MSGKIIHLCACGNLATGKQFSGHTCDECIPFVNKIIKAIGDLIFEQRGIVEVQTEVSDTRKEQSRIWRENHREHFRQYSKKRYQAMKGQSL